MQQVVLGALTMCLVLGGGAAWADNGSCAADTQRQVVVDQDIKPVSVSSDFDLASISSMAAKFGASIARPPEGFYLGRFSYTVDSDPTDTPEDCSGAIHIHLTLHLTERVIEIGRELLSQPCRQSAEIEHYQRHATADAAVIARYAALIRDHLTAEPIKPGEPHDWVSAIVERDIKPLNDDRRAAQNAINTPGEFAHIDGACSV
jgi:hypothetical protein